MLGHAAVLVCLWIDIPIGLFTREALPLSVLGTYEAFGNLLV